VQFLDEQRLCSLSVSSGFVVSGRAVVVQFLGEQRLCSFWASSGSAVYR
jgi:hypothetical protein